MQYRTLGRTGIKVSPYCLGAGRTGIKVSPYCLGAMMFGGIANPDHDDCTHIIHKALDAGINFVDTADRYSQGESEEIVGKALKGRRDEPTLGSARAADDEPGSPDFNPIENAFSKLKALLRKAAARTVDELWRVIGDSLDAFTPAECASYFAAAGYDAG